MIAVRSIGIESTEESDEEATLSVHVEADANESAYDVLTAAYDSLKYIGALN